jgi:endonuclease/exonuclease/phosphatase (EEP) superfamily protein YafD
LYFNLVDGKIGKQEITSKTVWIHKLIIVLGSLLLLVIMAMGSSLWGFSYFLEGLSHFQIQYWVAAMLLLGWQIILSLKRQKSRKSRQLLWTGLACVVVLSANLLTWYIPMSNQATPLLKVFSSNTWIYNQNYPELIELVRKEKPDVAMFFEVTPSGQNQLDTLNDILPHSVGRDTGALIYTKLSLTGTKIWQNDPNRLDTTIVENLQHLGQVFTLVATHPASPRSKEHFLLRNQELASLAEYLAASEQPLIVGGDFNMTMWSPYYRQFVDRSGLISTRKGFGLAPTWTPASIRSVSRFLRPWLSIPIDHIFIRSGKYQLQAMSMKAGSFVGSDHLPVIAEIGVSENQSKSISTRALSHETPTQIFSHHI